MAYLGVGKGEKYGISRNDAETIIVVIFKKCTWHQTQCTLSFFLTLFQMRNSRIETRKIKINAFDLRH